jgi:shikimate kinase
MNLVLFGFKKCGKTYYGKLLAQELNKTFINTDDLIEELYKMQFHEKLSCRQIFQKEGNEIFRFLETKAILSIKKELGAIISLGGGAPLEHKNLMVIQKLGKLVYLEADKDMLKQRMLSNEIPSFLDVNDPENSFEKMYAMRKPLYDQIKAVKVNIQEKRDQEILDILKKVFHGR